MVLLDGNANQPREVLGNKGYGIDAMRGRNLPVPPAFCITTAIGARFLADSQATMDAVWNDVLDRIGWLEAETGRTFGHGPCPLLVSVRSSAARSMPGMMDTVLDLGIDDAVEAALGAATAAAFARDTRQRFSRMYRRVVAGREVAADPHAQLRAAIEAVFASWNSPRAIAYRDHHRLDDHGGTAVVIQAMVFGNLGNDSGAGVLFSRNPISGADTRFGEWLPGGQGDDVVSGTFDVHPIAALQDEQPSVFADLMAAADTLERLECDVQEIEFTVEQGKLWLLQTRSAERSAQAAVRLALQLYREGLIDEVETLRRVTPAHLRTLLLPALQPEAQLGAHLLAKGLPACPGVASGRAYTDVVQALAAAEAGEDVILVRNSTSPDDVHGMLAARGIVTEVGGASSHAAVISRELGRVAVVGCGEGVVASLTGRVVTVNGNNGEVREGAPELTGWAESETPELRELADIARRVDPSGTPAEIESLVALLTALRPAGQRIR